MPAPPPEDSSDHLASASGEPRVSVIMIFYNPGEHFREAIESVLKQEQQDFELLLVDDGSSDGSSALAQQYAAQSPDRIRYLAHGPGVNRGMSPSRNLGIGEARGEFIAFLDSDDRWRPGKLRDQLAIFDDLPDLGAVFGAVNYWRSWAGGEDRVVATGHIHNVPVAPPEALLALYPLGRAPAPCPSDVMVRRSVARQVGGFEENFAGPRQMYEDQAFFAKLYLSEKVYFDDRCWLDYRIHDRSCVAEVTRSGQYDAVRQFFLSWLAAYLEQRRITSPRIRYALLKARLPYNVPGLRWGARNLAVRVRNALATVRDQ